MGLLPLFRRHRSRLQNDRRPKNQTLLHVPDHARRAKPIIALRCARHNEGSEDYREEARAGYPPLSSVYAWVCDIKMTPAVVRQLEPIPNSPQRFRCGGSSAER